MITREIDRFRIDVDGTAVGHTNYLDRDAERIFYHTEIDEEFGGRGLAGRLVEEALRQTGGSGMVVVAVCPYVRKWVEKNDPDFVDWRRPTPDDLTWLKKELA